MKPEDAKRLLNDSAFKEIQQLVRERVHKEWENQPDPDEQHKLWLTLDCIRRYHAALQSVANEIAQRQSRD